MRASLGVASRFITGYLYDPATDKARPAEQPSQPHAWMEVYLPGAGWVEFDPTNGIIGSERLVRVAVGRDPEQAMPIKGTFTGRGGRRHHRARRGASPHDGECRTARRCVSCAQIAVQKEGKVFDIGQ